MKTGYQFEKKTSVVFLISLVGSACNAIFQYVSVKSLSVPDFGEMNALLSVIAVVGSAASVVSYLSVQYTSIAMNESYDDPSEGNSKVSVMFSFMLKACPIIVCFVCMIAVVLSGVISVVLNIRNQNLIMLAALVGCTGIFPSLTAGILQGMNKFGVASITNNIGFVLKLIVSFILYLFGLGASSALYAVFFGNIVAFLSSLLFLKRADVKVTHISARQNVRAELFQIIKKTILLQVVISLYSNLDLFLIKNRFDPSSVGVYSSAMVIGKMSSYFVTALVFVLIPVSVSESRNDQTRGNSFRRATAYSLAISVGFLIVCKPVFHYVVIPILGKSYVLSEDYIVAIAALMIPYSVFSIISAYRLAMMETKFIMCSSFVSIIISVFVSSFFSDTIQNMLFSLTIVSLINSAINYVITVNQIKGWSSNIAG